MSDQKADLMIIGAGVLGTFHAYHAIKRGLSVLMLERNSRPTGATVRNFGQVVPSGLDRSWQPLGRESLEIYQSLQADHDLTVRNLGSIYLASNDEEQTLIEELEQINRDQGYSSQLLSRNECLGRFPNLKSDYCRGGLFFPEEVSVNPRRMIHRLHELLVDQSDRLKIRFGVCVTSLEQNEKGVVVAQAANGTNFIAEKAIVCSGSEFQILFPERFAASDIKAVKLQMLRLKKQADVVIPGNVLTGLSIRRYESFEECPSWNEIKAKEPQDSFWKKWGIHILFKQESDGSIILGDSHEYAPAAAAAKLGFDLRTDINQYFIDEGQKIFGLPSWDIQASWFGIYCQTSDPAGIFTQTIDDNIHIVTGIGGKGMTSSAGFARRNLGEIYD